MKQLVTYQQAGDRPFLERAAQMWCCPTCGYPPLRKVFQCENPACIDNPSHSDEWRMHLIEQHGRWLKTQREEQARREFRKNLREQGFAVAF